LSASQRSSDLVSELNWIALTVVSKEPTQFQATVPSLIDLFITDEPGLVRTISQFTLSGMHKGHDLFYGYYRVCDVTMDEPTQMCSTTGITRVKRLSCDVVEQDWTLIFNIPDVNGQVCYFNNLVLSIFERYVP
jgi:hypothetical protein